MSESVDDDVALGPLFDSSQKLVMDIENGTFSTLELQERIKQGIIDLERITILVNKMGLFSSNEMIDDVPTDSLQFLLVPCYLGLFHQNKVGEPTEKLNDLQKSIIYYRNYLQRLRNLTLIEERLVWEDNDDDENNGRETSIKLSAEEARQQKLERHRKKKALKENEAKIRKQLEAVTIDDGNLRDLYITQLLFWVERAFEELSSINEELPLLKMMAQRAENPRQPPAQHPPSSRKPIKPFVITRDAQQKKVFGLGYPGVPTMTVDEWYHNKFGCGSGPASAMQQPPPIIGGEKSGEHQSSDEDDDDEASLEEKRQKAIRYDEYKDSHRRGWGNTHNKG